MKVQPKFLFFCLILIPALFSNSELFSQSHKPDDIIGVWLNEERDGKVEIYRDGNKFYGKLVWLKNPIDEKTGFPRLDKENPNPELKKRELNGIVLMHDFEFKSSGDWGGGKIYDPKNGKTYSCYLHLDSPDKLKVRGYVGFSWIGRTTYWTRSALN